MKKLILWVGGILLSLALALVLLLFLYNQKEHRDQLARQREGREGRKIHIGDSPQTVKLRLGIPDTIYDGNKDREPLWIYRPRYSTGKSSPDMGVYFDSTLSSVTMILAYTNLRWVPEDGLTPSTGEYSDADVTLRQFAKVLGTPCDTLQYGQDSANLDYYFHLSPAELAEDKTYAKNSAGIVRLLSITLAKGKQVRFHGWSRNQRVCK